MFFDMRKIMKIATVALKKIQFSVKIVKILSDENLVQREGSVKNLCPFALKSWDSN